MSLGEILVVAVIALLVTKPEDIPVIIQHIRQLREAFSNITNKAFISLSQRLETTALEKILPENTDEINFYLQKIIAIQGQYQGEYTLERIKAKYHELIDEAIHQNRPEA